MRKGKETHANKNEAKTKEFHVAFNLELKNLENLRVLQKISRLNFEYFQILCVIYNPKNENEETPKTIP